MITADAGGSNGSRLKLWKLELQKLAEKMPGDLKVCYFVNSGSEANDLALLMARAYTGNYDVIALRNAYHGGNVSGMGMTAHSTWKFNVPHSFGVHHALVPDPYRGPYGRNDAEAGKKYAASSKMLFVDSVTPVSSPPITPEIATARSASAITQSPGASL